MPRDLLIQVPISRMQFGFAINNSKESSSDNDSGTIVRNKLSSHIISAVLIVALFSFIFSFLHFAKISVKQNSFVTENTVPTPTNIEAHVSTKKKAQMKKDYQYGDQDNDESNEGKNDGEKVIAAEVPKTPTATTSNRRHVFIDLGCFDARDIDYFLFFHSNETMTDLEIYAFEPDTINYFACKLIEQRHPDVNLTVVQQAAWIRDGEMNFATEQGRRSKIDLESSLTVSAVDFSQWLIQSAKPEDYVHLKLSIEGAEVPVLEKMVNDRSLDLVDYLEVEWNDQKNPTLEARRISLECMFDNFGMDFLYMISPIELRRAYNKKLSFDNVQKDRGWRLQDSAIRFHYIARKDVNELVLKRKKRL
ncbi:unnamed protein product [Didymodactylos carnosus]|uniref:Methyltransferase FkbM domain-containing protein n=1 Tax=Didymodactylos carnosus TaxID=1234261 RepID=A0A813T5F6_9BILA|nr:unnamed protein product [Didymodactylos carnosus]CAF1197199.1 unnamed protein product [Didymodactylos carnosus]CAF3593261.1 unnamed protein product [Didymodactylos carnosus]CAF4007444.1 unnamed protein product [Didymodactylos carnosus]